MSTRIYWRRAHPVRIPDNINTPPHLELTEAYRRDRAMAEMQSDIAAMIDWDLRKQIEDELEREFQVSLV